MYLSSVERYLTLSLASLSASVIALFLARHTLYLRDLHACSTSMICWQSSPRRSSQIELSFVARLRHHASSVRGPMSSSSSVAGSGSSSRSLVVRSAHSPTHASYLSTISGSAAACAMAAGRTSTLMPSGFGSVIAISSDSMPCREGGEGRRGEARG